MLSIFIMHFAIKITIFMFMSQHVSSLKIIIGTVKVTVNSILSATGLVTFSFKIDTDSTKKTQYCLNICSNLYDLKEWKVKF